MTDSLIDKNGAIIPQGSLITWNVWDSDDFITWKFIGIVRREGVVYLGGGIDFGSAVGKMIPFREVQEDAELNNPDERGITVLGKASDVPNILNKEFGI